MKFNEALEEVKQNQPYSPNHPTGEAAVFHEAVALAMGIRPEDLELYTAIGSTLDRFHGIDGFFSFDGIIVTLDITANMSKDEYKARVIVTIKDAENGYKQAAEEIAGWFTKSQHLDWKGVV